MLREYLIIIKDKTGFIIATIPGYVGSVIKAGETKTIDSSANADVSRAHSIEYVIQKYEYKKDCNEIISCNLFFVIYYE